MSNIVDLGKYTTFGIGPKVKAEIVTDLSSLVKNSSAIILGRGSNVLILNKIDRKAVINRAEKFVISKDVLYAESGCSLSFLAKHTASCGLGGLEWAYALPASVGGAIRMNAGAFFHDISESIIKVGVLRGGEVIELGADECGFSYRSSAFLPCDVILYAYFRLEKSSADRCNEKISQVFTLRSAQPKGKSAGCIYKTKGKSAGYYIEKANLKGKRIGDIFVSPIHAGFFINAGKGKCEDVVRLMDYVEKSVQDKEGVTLEKEIKIIGEI